MHVQRAVRSREGGSGGDSELRRHWVARPLPEPPRTRHVSRWTRQPLDQLERILEEWKKELSVGFTHEGD